MIRHTADSIANKNAFIVKLNRRLGFPSSEQRTSTALLSAMHAFGEVFGDEDILLVEKSLQLSPEWRSVVCNGCSLYDPETGQCGKANDADVKVAIGCVLELYVASAKRESQLATAY